jgi:methionine biosynthesis protein MetW
MRAAWRFRERQSAARHRPRRLGVSERYRPGLADYPDQAFDYVILSQTLQETRHPRQVLREMLRVGRRGIVAFPNFGHWRVRLSMLTSGGAPRTRLFPYEWYDSPNIHFLTVDDFENLAALEGMRGGAAVTFWRDSRKVRYAAQFDGGSGGVSGVAGVGAYQDR